jgi:inositol-phosphate phosphatase / L-galactose 1-phosphate phosphatase / histidinol-phosphatase
MTAKKPRRTRSKIGGRAPDLAEYVDFAVRLADRGRKVMAARLARPPDIEVKPDSSYVTDTDKAIERALRAMINKAYPGHGILGEEYGPENPDADYVWALDPIDGTAAFVAGLPVFGTLIALLHRGTPVVGIIDHLVTDDRWIGAAGRPSTRNGRTIRTRRCPNLARAMLSASNPDFFDPAERPRFERLRQATQWRIYGGSCYSYGLLAAGRTDMAIDTALSIHDYAPYVPILEGAGGIITDWSGRPVTVYTGRQILAAGDPARHAEALKLING